MTLWTAHDMVEATGGVLSAPFAATGVSIDTRTLARGDLFIALVGEGRDGHGFVAEALGKGASGAMVHKDASASGVHEDASASGVHEDASASGVHEDASASGVHEDASASGVHEDASASGPVLRVDDTLAGLARLGDFARARFTEGRVVAITGSVGKTTTKEMLRGALSSFGRTHAAVASYNNHWGVPLTLARLPSDARFCVAEIGMNHAGEILPLTRLVSPDVAVITAIARAHVGHLGSIEAIADEKGSIMRGLRPGGVAVLPADAEQLPRLRDAARGFAVLTFGADESAHVRLLRADADAGGSVIHVSIVGRAASLRLNAPGRHMAMNAVATLAAVVALGLDPMPAIGALEAFQPLAGRGLTREVAVEGGSALLLDETYNGNGASMRAALDVLRLQPARRRIAVLGDMLELGEEGPAEHAALAEPVTRSVDLLFTCGPLMRGLFDRVPAALRATHAPDAAALAPIVAAALAGGDAVLVKGSQGSDMRRVIQGIAAASAPASGAARAG